MHAIMCIHSVLCTCTGSSHVSVVAVPSSVSHLVFQHKDEDIVGAHSQNQEGHHLQDDQGGWDAYPGIEAHGGQHGTAHHQDTPQTHQELGVHLRGRKPGVQCDDAQNWLNTWCF